MADYKKEIDEVLKKEFVNRGFEEFFKFEEFVQEMFSEIGTSYEKMSQDLEEGILKGYSLEFQLGLMEAYLIK